MFTSQKITLQPDEESQPGLTFRYELDAARTPKQIITTHELDPGKPIVQKGIYAREGKTLRLHLEAAGKEPPSTWESKTGGTSTLFVLQRVQTRSNR